MQIQIRNFARLFFRSFINFFYFRKLYSLYMYIISEVQANNPGFRWNLGSGRVVVAIFIGIGTWSTDVCDLREWKI